MPTLIVSEKNKAALAIAEALGTVNTIKKSKFLNVYSIPSKDIYVIPLRGHILEYQNTDTFKSWTKSIPREIITDANAIKKNPISYAYPYIKTLKEYARKCDKCIIGTDADIEGCNIGLIDAFPYVKQENNSILVYQLWLSSLEEREIRNKFNHLITPKWSWAESGEARAIIDAIIGFSSTREITNTFRPLLEKLNYKLISIGRVQTSLLYLIYLRDQAIKKFIPEPYWIIEADLEYKDQIIKAFHHKNPFDKEHHDLAISIYEKIKYEKIAKILNNNKEMLARKPPLPLNTSKALVLLTKHLKINANLAMKTMNDLYLNKIISYPRTESDKYKADFNHIQYLKKFGTHSIYGKYTNNLIIEERTIPTIGKKDAGDHPPITPIESLELKDPRLENELQKKVYDILARHYLALFGKDAKESKTTLKLLIKDEIFISRLVSLIFKGFYEIAPFLKKSYDTNIEIEGNELPIKSISCNKKFTQPPPKYSDTTLLKLMEKEHLGTKSTRPTIIQILLKRKLIQRSKRIQYSITDLGLFLIEELIKIWLPFLKPEFTREVEVLLEEIKEEKKTKEEVVKIVKHNFLLLFDKFLHNKKDITVKVNDFKESNKRVTQMMANIHNVQITTSKCPVCKNSPMKLIIPAGKRRFLACINKNCKSFLSVPKSGRIYIIKSSICLKCGFNVFKIVTWKNKKAFTYFLCPNCWTEGLKNKLSQGFCSSCNDYEFVNNSCKKR